MRFPGDNPEEEETDEALGQELAERFPETFKESDICGTCDGRGCPVCRVDKIPVPLQEEEDEEDEEDDSPLILHSARDTAPVVGYHGMRPNPLEVLVLVLPGDIAGALYALWALDNGEPVLLPEETSLLLGFDEAPDHVTTPEEEQFLRNLTGRVGCSMHVYADRVRSYVGALLDGRHESLARFSVTVELRNVPLWVMAHIGLRVDGYTPNFMDHGSFEIPSGLDSIIIGGLLNRTAERVFVDTLNVIQTAVLELCGHGVSPDAIGALLPGAMTVPSVVWTANLLELADPRHPEVLLNALSEELTAMAPELEALFNSAQLTRDVMGVVFGHGADCGHTHEA